RSDAHGDGRFRSPFTGTQHGLGPERSVLYVLAARRQPRRQDQLAGKTQKTIAVAVVLPDDGLAAGPRLDLGSGEQLCQSHGVLAQSPRAVVAEGRNAGQGGSDADDDQDDHHLEQGEALLGTRGSGMAPGATETDQARGDG